MSGIVQITNPDVSENIKTFLSQEYSSGTTLYVDSSVSFANGNYILVGEPGLENSEIGVLSASPGSATTLTIGALSFSHPRGTPVYYLLWDKYELDYKTSSSGAWTTYGSMPTNLRYDATYTEYRDSSATSSYYWRYRYYSTEKTAYSDYSDSITAAGWGRFSVGYMVDKVRKIINDPERKTVSDEEIIDFFNSAQDIIYTTYDRWWFLLKIGTVIDTVASTKKYSLPTDFGRMHTVLYRYDDGTTDITYNLKYLPMVEFDYQDRDNDAATNDNLKYYTLYPGDSSNDTGYLYVNPTPTTAGYDLTPRYYKTFTVLSSFADETEVPLPTMLQNYALGEIFKRRKEEAKADYYDKAFRQQIELLKLMQRKQVGQPRYLWKYQGRGAEDRYFGSMTAADDNESNW